MENTVRLVMNSATREVLCWFPGIDTVRDMNFVPYNGQLPPVDFKTGLRIAHEQATTVAGPETFIPATEEQRIERIAAAIPLVPKAEMTDKGVPSIPVLERMSGVPKITTADRAKAMKLIVDRRTERQREKEAAIAAETSPEQAVSADEID